MSRTAWPGALEQVTLSVRDLNGNRLAEHDDTGAVLREYIWLDGRPLAVIEGGQTYWLHWDHILRPVMATDAAGSVVWTARYLPFGGIDEVSVDTGVIEQNLRFPGQWFEPETGLHQNWMRDYDPTTGRYLQADPLGLVDGASVYGYARQSPVRYVDPRGEQTLGCHIFGVGCPPQTSPWPQTPEVGDWPPEPEAAPPRGGYCPLPGLPGGIADGSGDILLPDLPVSSGQACENCNASDKADDWEKACEDQLEADLLICRQIAKNKRACYSQAMVRYAKCRATKGHGELPPFPYPD